MLLHISGVINKVHFAQEGSRADVNENKAACYALLRLGLQ